MSKNNSPVKFIGGMMGSTAASFSGGAAAMAQRVQNARNAPGGLSANMNNASVYNSSFQNAVSSLFERNNSSTPPPPRNPGAVRDPNNMNAGSGSGVSVSQADLNTSQNRNSGPGVLTSSMHQMNSNTPMVKPPGETFKTVNPSFRNSIVEKGDGMFGDQEQRQASIDPVQDLNIDQTGMNSLYGEQM